MGATCCKVDRGSSKRRRDRRGEEDSPTWTQEDGPPHSHSDHEHHVYVQQEISRVRAAYSILDLDADLKRAADAQIRTGGYEHGGPSSFSGSNHRASTSNMKNQSEGSERSRSNIYAGGRQETSEPGVERREIHMCRQTRAGGEEGVLRDHVRRIAVVMAKSRALEAKAQKGIPKERLSKLAEDLVQAHVQSLGRSIGDAEECGVEALLAVQEKYLESGLDGLIYNPSHRQVKDDRDIQSNASVLAMHDSNPPTGLIVSPMLSKLLTQVYDIQDQRGATKSPTSQDADWTSQGSSGDDFDLEIDVDVSPQERMGVLTAAPAHEMDACSDNSSNQKVLCVNGKNTIVFKGMDESAGRGLMDGDGGWSLREAHDCWGPKGFERTSSASESGQGGRHGHHRPEASCSSAVDGGDGWSVEHAKSDLFASQASLEERVVHQPETSNYRYVDGRDASPMCRHCLSLGSSGRSKSFDAEPAAPECNDSVVTVMRGANVVCLAGGDDFVALLRGEAKMLAFTDSGDFAEGRQHVVRVVRLSEISLGGRVNEDIAAQQGRHLQRVHAGPVLDDRSHDLISNTSPFKALVGLLRADESMSLSDDVPVQECRANSHPSSTSPFRALMRSPHTDQSACSSVAASPFVGFLSPMEDRGSPLKGEGDANASTTVSGLNGSKTFISDKAHAKLQDRDHGKLHGLEGWGASARDAHTALRENDADAAAVPHGLQGAGSTARGAHTPPHDADITKELKNLEGWGSSGQTAKSALCNVDVAEGLSDSIETSFMTSPTPPPGSPPLDGRSWRRGAGSASDSIGSGEGSSGRLAAKGLLSQTSPLRTLEF